MGVPVPGRSELAGAASDGAEASADAGGLRRAARWTAAAAGLFAQPGRESARLGRAARRSVPARVAGREPATDPDRRLRRIGGGDSDGLSAGAASTLLGAQDAQYFGTC